jgi:hypothetical protein
MTSAAHARVGLIVDVRCSEPCLSCNYLVDHLAMHIRRAEVAAAIAAGEFFVIDSQLVQDGCVDVVDAAPPQMTSVSSRCPRCFRSAIFNSTARSNIRSHCSKKFSVKNLASTARMSQRSFERRFQQAARLLLHDLSPPCPHQRRVPNHREFIAFATPYFINLRIL